MSGCRLCPRQCGADRAGGQIGRCGAGESLRLARAALHFGEEPCISGTAGSGAVFFSHCPLHCRFCQNYGISQTGVGKDITPARLADIFRELEEQGAHNINLVSPTPYVPLIAEAIARYRPSVPLIYNSSGYERVETLRRLEGLIDVYLPDYKYADNTLSNSLSGVSDYVETSEAAILEMVRQTGAVRLDENGLIRRGTLVRHLVLPGHTNHSLQALDWLAAHRASGLWVSLLFQYTPVRAVPGEPALSRTLTARERDKVFRHLLDCHLTDGYVQEADSADARFIPDFDLTGV